MYVTAPNNFLDAKLVVSQLPLVDYAPSSSSIKTIAAGSMIFCEGDESLFVYEVFQGVVRTSKFLCDGRRQVISFGYPGDLIGISHDCRYHSDCDAVSDVKVRVHRKNACNAQATIDPAYCEMLLRQTAAEVNSMQEHFMMLGRKSALEKVASFLNVLSRRVGSKGFGQVYFDLPMSRADIGDFLGLTIETVSRAFTRLRKSGVIELPNPHSVCVLQPDALAELAERND
ncbi:MAG: helix-turn-helix domain-containing protein [Rhizobiaceae bacterium]